MSNIFHKNLIGTDVHRPYSWEYADATVRGAATGFVTSEIGRIARQLDDNSLWMLTAITPVWKDIGTGASAHSHGNLGQLDLVTDGNHDVISSGNPHSVTKTEVGLGNVDDVQQIPMSQKGATSGVATLDAAGTVPSVQLDILQTDIITVTSTAQTTFILSKTPLHVTSVLMVPENGIEQINTIDFTVTGTSISYIASTPSFVIGEKIAFTYAKINP